MKRNRFTSRLIALIIFAIIFVSTSSVVNMVKKHNNVVDNKVASSDSKSELTDEALIELHALIPHEIDIEDVQTNVLLKEKEPEPEKVYDGLTREELINKLNNVLHSNLSGWGESFVNYSLELGVDPYLAVAIVLQETGCYWNCSAMVRDCNNIGGMKAAGDFACWGGSYAGYNSLDTGVKYYMYNLKNTYVNRGMVTAEQMHHTYAEDPEWANRVNNYINIIRNS